MLESIPDLSELLVTAPMAIIVLIFIAFVFKLLIKLVTELIKLVTLFSGIVEKLIELVKDLKR